IGAVPSMQVSPIFLLSGNRSIKGWYSGTSIDSQNTLAFSARTGVRSMNETFPLERVDEAYDRMMSGKARFRVVLTIGQWRLDLSPLLPPRTDARFPRFLLAPDGNRRLADR